MIILAIESSCDETSAAICRDGRDVLSNIVWSQTEAHARYGGVVPEIASRKHIEVISKVTECAAREAGIAKDQIDAVAVTYAPGLIGALLVGVNFAKAVAHGLDVPLIPVHHLRGHVASNYIAFPEFGPPFVCMLVSGGHTSFVHVRGYTDMAVLGSTRDDAAGEAFDKVARMIGLAYPGGAALDALAREGGSGKYALPRAKVEGNELDMSFSGLKTAALNVLNTCKMKDEDIDRASLAASFTAAVCDMLVPRAVRAARVACVTKLAAAGGVAANSWIRMALAEACAANSLELILPPPALCGDNAAMIGCQAYYEYKAGARADMSLNALASCSIM